MFSEANLWHKWTVSQQVSTTDILYLFPYSSGQSCTKYWHQWAWKTRTSVWII